MVRNVIWEDVLQQEAHRRRDQENQARRAYAELRFDTHGGGEFTTPEALRFPQPFIQEPHFTSGVRMTLAPNREWFYFPQVTVGIVDWTRNARGFYLGARLFFHVYVELRPGKNPMEVPPMLCNLTHFLTFSGIAYKSLGSRVQSQISTDPQLQTRSTEL